MPTAIRTARFIGIAGLVVGSAAAPLWVHAQTPAQMQYEQQQREARQSQQNARQEQQRMQQLQNDNARRQQGQSSPGQQRSPGPAGPASQGGSYGSPSADGAICEAKPVRAGERNAVLGRWRLAEAPAAGGDALTQGLAALVCSVYSGGLEFRERSMLVRGQVLPAVYGRDGNVWLVCAGESPGSFRLGGPNRLNMVKPACVFDRVGASPSATAPGQATAAGADAARPAPGSHQSSQRWR